MCLVVNSKTEMLNIAIFLDGVYVSHRLLAIFRFVSFKGVPYISFPVRLNGHGVALTYPGITNRGLGF